MSFFKSKAVPAVLFGIAIMGAIADTMLVRAATHGDAFASDPGYYERALDWDAHMAATADTQRLGIVVTTEFATLRDHGARLCVALRDANGGVVEASSVATVASANLCPLQRIKSTHTSSGDAYCADLDTPCAGVWRVDVEARVGGVTIAATSRVELEPAP